MFEKARFKLRGFKDEPYSFLEVIDCRLKDNRFTLTVIETDGRVLSYSIEDYENIFEIVDKVLMESIVRTLIVSDNRKHKHYWRVL